MWRGVVAWGRGVVGCGGVWWRVLVACGGGWWQVVAGYVSGDMWRRGDMW